MVQCLLFRPTGTQLAYDTISASDLNKGAQAHSEVNELNGETGDLIVMMPSLSLIMCGQKWNDDLNDVIQEHRKSKYVVFRIFTRFI